MKKISGKKQKDLAHQKRVRAKLLLECATNSRGAPLCPQCGKLPDLKDGRGELHLCHEKSLAQGGHTSYRNCYLACRVCHSGPDGHRVENMPKSKPIDRPYQLSGYTTGVRPYSKEQQCGIKKKKED